MPDRNLLLAFALSFAVLTLWSMYQSEPPPPRGYPAGTEVVEGSDRTAWGDGAGDPTAPGGSAARSRIPPVPGREARAVPGVAETEPQAGQPIATEVEYEVDRSLYHARLSNIGASLTHWELNAYHDSFGEPIVLTTALEPGEVLTEVSVPTLDPGSGWSLTEISRRHGDFAIVGAAVTVRLDDAGCCADPRIVLFGQDVAVSGGVFRATEGLLEKFGGDHIEETRRNWRAYMASAGPREL